MPNAVYPLLLLMVVYVLGAAFFKSELFGHALLLAFAMVLMLVIRHYSELYVWGLAYQTRTPLARYFLANSAITVASVAPALVLGLNYTASLAAHLMRNAPMSPAVPIASGFPLLADDGSSHRSSLSGQTHKAAQR